jgi:CDGSH-type Zn-finger protein
MMPRDFAAGFNALGRRLGRSASESAAQRIPYAPGRFNRDRMECIIGEPKGFASAASAQYHYHYRNQPAPGFVPCRHLRSRAMAAFDAKRHRSDSMSTHQPTRGVVVSKDGPYLVTGAIPIAKQTIATDSEGGSETWVESEARAVPDKYALCRCGHSKKKPFCDGTHAKIGFNGSETASRRPYAEQASVTDGPTMKLSDAESLCAFGRFCDPNGQVWNQVAGTGHANVRAMFIRQVGNCPGGRLVAWDKATGKAVEPTLPVSIGLVEDPAQDCSGPLWLRGGIPVVAADGFEYEVRNRVTLCRCGASKNKPFCDGSHAAIKFRDR